MISPADNDHHVVVLGITGASGAIYGVRTAEILKELGFELYIIITDEGMRVLSMEVPDWEKRLKSIANDVHSIKNADRYISGSTSPYMLLVAPCTINTLIKVALGISDNNLLRTIQVCIKEGVPIGLLVREMPWPPQAFKAAHDLSIIGVKVVPASPPLYGDIESIHSLIDNVVGRFLKVMGIENDLYKKWKWR